MKTLSLSEVKMKLSRLVDDIAYRDEEVTITRNGRPVAMIISPEEFEGWQETLAIRSNKELMKEIKRGLKTIKKSKKSYTLDELFEAD